MEVPYEFEQFVKFFYPGSADGTTTLREWIEQDFELEREKSRNVIRQFLDELLSGRHIQIGAAPPSPGHQGFAAKVGLPGLIQSHVGMYYFGPPLRPVR